MKKEDTMWWLVENRQEGRATTDQRYTLEWFRNKTGYQLGDDPYDDNWTDYDLADAYLEGLLDGNDQS